MPEEGKQVIITTEWRGVFHGVLVSYDEDARRTKLANVCNVIFFSAPGGWLRLACEGPREDDNLGVRAPSIILPGVTSVTECSAEAEAAWLSRM